MDGGQIFFEYPSHTGRIANFFRAPKKLIPQMLHGTGIFTLGMLVF